MDQSHRNFMNNKHASFPQPDNVDALVWRYLSLDKLIHILLTKKLYLSRIDNFSDKQEGYFPKVVHQYLNNFLQTHLPATI